MECSVCYEQVDEFKKTDQDDCVNETCTECLIKFIESQIEEGEDRIRCLCEECQLLRYCFIDEILSVNSDNYTKLIDQLDNNVESNSSSKLVSRIFYCEDCDKVTRKEYDLLDSYTDFPIMDIGEVEVQCKYCFDWFCDNCSSTNCDGECRDILTWEESLSAHDCEEKRCPKCRTILMLESGCASVQCYACKFRFCWSCLEYVSRETSPNDHDCSEFQGYDSSALEEDRYSDEETTN